LRIVVEHEQPAHALDLREECNDATESFLLIGGDDKRAVSDRRMR